MGKRRKGRCVKRNQNVHTEPEEFTRAPHSFIIHRGLPGGNILDLTKDFRKVMEPFTAGALKERKKNTIKDFVSIAGPLHVTHLCIFTRTELGVYLKLSRLPRGPTLTFKIHNFCLARDVISSLKKQLVFERAFKHSPLIILNSFTGEGMQMKLMASMFQNMFPTINLTKVDLNDIRRCVMLNYNPTTKLIDFRHYIVKVVPVGVSKGVKKIVQGKVPNLANCIDISELLTRSGVLSESEMEEDPNSHVILSQKLITRGNMEQGKSAIRLSELGPRLTLQLIKIEDGLLDGEVLYHDLIHKTEEEKADIQRKREQKRKLKHKRKTVQEENKKRKDAMKQDHKEKSLKGILKNTDSENPLQTKSSENNEMEVVDDDAEYYRQEIGEEPDKDLFSMQHGKRRSKPMLHFKSKRPRFNDEKTGKQGNKRENFSQNRNNKFPNTKYKGKGVDKTNSQNRDHRAIGGNARTKTRKVIGSKILKHKKKK